MFFAWEETERKEGSCGERSGWKEGTDGEGFVEKLEEPNQK